MFFPCRRDGKAARRAGGAFYLAHNMIESFGSVELGLVDAVHSGYGAPGFSNCFKFGRLFSRHRSFQPAFSAFQKIRPLSTGERH